MLQFVDFMIFVDVIDCGEFGDCVEFYAIYVLKNSAYLPTTFFLFFIFFFTVYFFVLRFVPLASVYSRRRFCAADKNDKWSDCQRGNMKDGKNDAFCGGLNHKVWGQWKIFFFSFRFYVKYAKNFLQILKLLGKEK